MKKGVILDLDMNDFEKERLLKLFGVRIGLALVRSDVTYAILYDWYFQGILISQVKKVRGIGKLSALIIYRKFENFLLSCLHLK